MYKTWIMKPIHYKIRSCDINTWITKIQSSNFTQFFFLDVHRQSRPEKVTLNLNYFQWTYLDGNNWNSQPHTDDKACERPVLTWWLMQRLTVTVVRSWSSHGLKENHRQKRGWTTLNTYQFNNSELLVMIFPYIIRWKLCLWGISDIPTAQVALDLQIFSAEGLIHHGCTDIFRRTDGFPEVPASKLFLGRKTPLPVAGINKS